MNLLWSSVDTWTSDDTQGAWMLVMIIILYFIRNESPVLRTIWDVFKIIMFVILIITTLGLAIKWLKKVF